MKRTLVNILIVAATVAIVFGLDKVVSRLQNDPSLHAGYPVRILMLALIAVIAAVSLNLVNGFTGQFSMGHAAFYGIGAYTGAALTVFAQKQLFGHILAIGEETGWWLSSGVLLLAMLVGGLAAALTGFVVGLPSLKLRGDYLAIMTVGFNMIVVVIANNLKEMGGAAGFNGVYVGDTLIGIPPLTTFFWVALVAIAVVVLSINLRRSVHGLAFESIREDEIAAEAMGIPTTRYKVTAFVLAAFIAGAAGALYVHFDLRVSPADIDFIVSINFVVMVVLGGLGSVSGAVIGAILLTVLPEALRMNGSYRLVIYSIMLIVLMLVRPQGIFGRDEIGRAWMLKQVQGTKTLPARISGWTASLFDRFAHRRLSS
ncbi:MAG: branched-chain amino acid ABC transporter permease [Capsulimonadaceae bacterium]|nr:branched-chain amino acid ABC transporter permease [Capsulimonadaceae bacterium]